MKVAIVHDWLNTKFGGAENVLVELAELFPEAPIFTILYDQSTAGRAIAPERIHPSRLQSAPAFLRHRPRYLLPFIPGAIERFDLSGYDVVISSSSAWVKGVITKPETLNICYCYSPMRFAWDYWPRYVEEQQVGPLRRAAIHVLTSRLRLWDYYSAARVDRWVAISHHVAARIRKYYRQPADAVSVIYPGADISAFAPQPTKKEDYFLTLSSLTPYKKIDVAIEACNRLGRRLIVAGDGADRARLERLAGDSIEFTGRVSDNQRADLLARAQAFIFPGEEDFGIAPVEAMASGTPVIAYNRGGLTETVAEGRTGMFFDKPTADSLAAVLERFNPKDYKLDDLTTQAAKFTTTAFRTSFRDYVEKAYREYQTQR